MDNQGSCTASLTDGQKKLVESNLGLVGSYLRKTVVFASKPTARCEYDDLFQEGTLGLMRAAARFDPRRDRTFVAFALKHIHGAVSRALAERFSTIRVPAKAVKQARRRQRERTTGCGLTHACHDSGTQSTAMITTANLGKAAMQLRARAAAGGAVGRRLGDLLRLRYEAAVRAAGERLRLRGRGRADRSNLIERLVLDRLLIPEESERTSLRRIAREFNSTAGRALACERQITRLAADILRQDPVYRRVRELAAAHEESLEVEVGESLERDLVRRELRCFRRQVESLSRERSQWLLMKLAGHVCGNPARLLPMLFEAMGAGLRSRVLMEALSHQESPSAAE